MISAAFRKGVFIESLLDIVPGFNLESMGRAPAQPLRVGLTSSLGIVLPLAYPAQFRSSWSTCSSGMHAFGLQAIFVSGSIHTIGKPPWCRQAFDDSGKRLSHKRNPLDVCAAAVFLLQSAPARKRPIARTIPAITSTAEMIVSLRRAPGFQRSIIGSASPPTPRFAAAGTAIRMLLAQSTNG